MQNVKTVARRTGLGAAAAAVAAVATMGPASAYAPTITGTQPATTAGFDANAAAAANWTYSWTIDANGATHYTYGDGSSSSAGTANSAAAAAAPAPTGPAAASEGLSTQSAESDAPVATSGIAATAMQYVGTGYAWGGTTPAGWDCSGFTQYVYAQHGIDLPRIAAAQGNAGTVTANPQPGDLVIQNGGAHVGIYLGNGQMISALNPSQGTQVHPVSAMSVDKFVTF